MEYDFYTLTFEKTIHSLAKLTIQKFKILEHFATVTLLQRIEYTGKFHPITPANNQATVPGSDLFQQIVAFNTPGKSMPGIAKSAA